jgi:hypothetical protein
LRVSESLSASPDLPGVAAQAKRSGVEVQIGPEGAPTPKGWETVHLATLPIGGTLRAALARFPITLEEGGFLFDGRTYTGPEDAILLRDPAKPAETFVLGNSAASVLELCERRGLRAAARLSDYEVVSGDLAKQGRLIAEAGRLAIDAASDRDGIAARDRFFAELKPETRGAVQWEVRAADAAAAAKWEKAASGFAGKKPFTVRVFPDAAVKALYTGSSRPADLVADGGRIRVDLDAAALAEPDLVSPVFAAAALAAADPRLLARPILLSAAGARRAGTWWGRDVRGFGAFARAAGVEPTVGEILGAGEGISPIIAVGAAAAWLDAGVRLESEAATAKALTETDAALATRLARWRDAAARQPIKPPARRALPDGFLRGVSYAPSDSLEDAWVSPRSLETLKRLREIGASSISLTPAAFARDAASEDIAFVRRGPRGETDEGTLRAVADARALGMSAMIRPQIWLGGGAAVGDVAMADDAAWRRWFESYRRFIVHYALVAEASGATLFAAGADLSGTEPREKEWRETFAAVRLATGATVLYAANGGARAAAITFWDALDALGVDFHDPLGKAEKLPDAALEEGARRAARPVADLAARVGKPVIFTEAGYPAVAAAWIAPRDEDSARPSGGEDAARAIAAVFRALGRESWWKGVYWWRVSSDGTPALPGERGFNLLGTPAEKAVRDGFRKTAPAP